MLVKAQRIDYSVSYTFSPPSFTALVNTEEIVEVYPVETRRSDGCCRVVFRNGAKADYAGGPEQFLGGAS